MVCVLIVDYYKARTTKCFLQQRVFNILHEIGRLRSHREVGEGTNESIDLDKFDQYYHHLFLWDEDAKKIRSLPYGSRFRNLSQIRHRGILPQRAFRFEPELHDMMYKSIEMGHFSLKNTNKTNAFILLWKIIHTTLRFPDHKFL
jgi:hypothetical protein